MKRSWIKRGTKGFKRSNKRWGVSRGKLSRSKRVVSHTRRGSPTQPSLKALKARLWELCKQITRKRYILPNGTWNCFTCDRLIDEPAKAHTGHGIASSVGGGLLRYHLDNLRIQDYFCNINVGGNGGEFYRRLVIEIGQERVDELYRLKQQTVKVDRQFLEEKIKEYEKL